jgi:thiosulfate reductase cytochrome b subunit
MMRARRNFHPGLVGFFNLDSWLVYVLNNLEPDKYWIRVFLGRGSKGKRHDHDETFHAKTKQANDRLRALLTTLVHG